MLKHEPLGNLCTPVKGASRAIARWSPPGKEAAPIEARGSCRQHCLRNLCREAVTFSPVSSGFL